MKEILKNAAASHLFSIISFNDTEIYYGIKSEMEKHFSNVVFESNSMPRWKNELNAESGKQTKIISFKRKINREELPSIKSKTLSIQDKFSKKEPIVKIIPGYLSAHNVIISSSLDDFQRVYLFHGVYAEIAYKYEKQRMIAVETAPEFFKSSEPVYYFTNLREAHVQTIK